MGLTCKLFSKAAHNTTFIATSYTRGFRPFAIAPARFARRFGATGAAQTPGHYAKYFFRMNMEGEFVTRCKKGVAHPWAKREMIKCKTEITIEVFKPPIKYNLKKQNSAKVLMKLLPILIIFIGLIPFIRPEEMVLMDSWILLLGITLLFIPHFTYKIVISNLKKNPAFGTTIEWEIDEKGINGKGKGFTMSEDWELFFEIHSTKLGILVYPQKFLFYWLPKAGFIDEKEYKQVLLYVKAKSKNVTYSKDNKKEKLSIHGH